MKTNKSIPWEIHLTQLLIIIAQQMSNTLPDDKGRDWEFNTKQPASGKSLASAVTAVPNNGFTNQTWSWREISTSSPLFLFAKFPLFLSNQNWYSFLWFSSNANKSFLDNLKNVLRAQRLLDFVGRGFLSTLTAADSDWMRPVDWCCR